jgi:hypothetical protein
MRQKLCNRRVRHERGQSLILVALAIFALLGFVGLAVDLGLSYVDRVRVRRAADAAALAAATELPLEAAAQVRALEYLEANGYPCGLVVQNIGGNLVYSCTNPETQVEINSGYPGSYVSGPGAEAALRVIRINTIPYRDDAAAGDTANRIEVNVQQRSSVFFMRVFGFDSVAVNGRAVGENINNLDVALVFDISGSMEFDTLCYGCWTPVSGQTYPEGARWPLPWNGPANGPPAHCSGSGSPRTYNGQTYIIIEAEEYSRNNVPASRELFSRGMTYWVLQRNGGTGLSTTDLPSYMRHGTGAGALGRDSRGAFIAHFPYRNHTNSDGSGSNCTWADLTNGEKCLRDAWIYSLGGPFTTPRVDYDFQVPSNGTWYVWVRGQGRDGGTGNLMWGLNRTPIGSVVSDEDSDFRVRSGFIYNAARSGDWRWVRMGSQYLNAGTTHELNLWAGGVGFAVDRIIITTDSRTPINAANNTSGFTTNVLNNTANIDNNRTDRACNTCDERFGGYPNAPGGNQPPHCVIPGFPEDHLSNYRYLHDIYDDEQPIRGAKEAAARFVERFDPLYDQVGYVTYSSGATIVSELECVRRCSIPANNCTCSKERMKSRVTDRVRASTADGGTNIPHGLRLGIDVLSSRSGHFGRPGAAHIMVFMTDGETNTLSGVDAVCHAQDYWPHNGSSQDVNRSKDCTVYYARLARNNGIVIYSITLGDGADIELMQYIAELTGGVHRHAPRPEQLDPIFEELYNRIFLRLVE